MTDQLQTIQKLPWDGFIPITLIVITGFVLWAAGLRLLRVGFAIVGLMAGWCVGWMIAESASVGMPSWVAGMMGAGLFVGIALLAYRAAVAGAMTALFLVGAPLIVVSAVEIVAGKPSVSIRPHRPVVEENALPPDDHGATAGGEDSEESGWEQIYPKEDRARDALSAALGDAGAEQVEKAELYSRQLLEQAKTQWEKTPQKMRPTLILSAVIGGLVGFLLGIIAPSLSAAAVTSLSGSAMWLTGVRMMAIYFEVPDGPWLLRSSTVFLIVWLITTIIGMAVQWTIQRKPADKAEQQA